MKKIRDASSASKISENPNIKGILAAQRSNMTTASTEKIKLSGLKKVASVALIQSSYRIPEKTVKLRNETPEQRIVVEHNQAPILRKNHSNNEDIKLLERNSRNSSKESGIKVTFENKQQFTD